MKSLAVIMLVMSALLTGCVVAEPPYHGDNRSEYRGDRDRDHDGVPDREDRRPDDSHRY